MEQERRRIKRAAVSEETRHGRRRAAINPNARRVDEDVDVENEEDEYTEHRPSRRRGEQR